MGTVATLTVARAPEPHVELKAARGVIRRHVTTRTREPVTNTSFV